MLSNTCLAQPRLTVLIFFCLAIFNAQAQEDENLAETQDWYQIEYVLFEHKTGDRHELRYESLPHFHYRTPEDNRRYQYYFPQPYFQSRNALLDNHLAPVNREETELSDAHQRLARDRRTDVLHFRAWQQALGNDSQSLPMMIDQGLENGWHLNGTVTIRRERYLHFDIDVSLFRKQWFPEIDWFNWVRQTGGIRLDQLLLPLNENQANQDDPVLANKRSWLAVERVQLQDSRRIKDGERHYVDHPALGVIATIRKIESPFSLEYAPL